LSTLTKVFVVLLVILSMLLTAATVVFVNRVENFKAVADNTQAQLNLEKARSSEAINSANSARNQVQAALTQSLAQVEQLKGAGNTKDAEISKLNTQIATLTSADAMKAANIAQLSEALKASEDQKAKQHDMIVDLRGSNDKYIKQFADQSARVSELTEQLEATERLRRQASEQNQELSTQLDRSNKVLQDKGWTNESPTPQAGAPNINGVIRETRSIGGVRYATISLGSADGVVKGMELKVIDRDAGQFLAIVTIDSVEPNESTGRLTGPRATEVNADPKLEVRTQL
jgi:hypothetical protein